jgi:PLP dependent protein
VHFIGRLQSNKVRTLAGVVDVWETVDRSRLVAELARRASGARVLVQVDTTAEPGKGGCPLAGVPALVAEAADAGLQVEGLMTVGPTEGGPEAARPGFRAVRRLVDKFGLPACSMGMSDDLDVAVEEGSTEVRVGTALFGARPSRSA